MIVEEAKNYAISTHNIGVNQFYDTNKPYSFHLEMVYNFAWKFIDIIPKQHKENVLAACWLHDIIEDGRETYNDVAKRTNKEVAELVYALTNEKGRTRKERANDKYYQGIKQTPYATFIKLADRLANLSYSISVNNKRMSRLYCKENKEFIKQLFDEKYIVMIKELEKLCEGKKN